MLRSLTLITLAGLSGLALPTGARAGGSFQRYGIESGIVEYAVTGGRSGTETLYFDDWGRREARYGEVTVELFGTVQTLRTLVLVDGPRTWNVDLDTRRATMAEDRVIRELLERGGSGETSDPGTEYMKRLGGWKSGTETVAGRPCEVWKISGSTRKIWAWKGVPLKIVTSEAGRETVSVATRVEENAAVPEEKLRLQEGVRIVDPTRGADLFPSLEKKDP
jgi:hypothetical protein